MSAVIHTVCGGYHRDKDAYGNESSGTITISNGLIKAALGNSQSKLSIDFPNDMPAQKTFRFLAVRNDGIEDWSGAAGSKVLLYEITATAGVFRIYAVYVDSGGYNIQLVQNFIGTDIYALTGPTKFSFATGGAGAKHLLFQTNGSSVELWYGPTGSISHEVSSGQQTQISIALDSVLYFFGDNVSQSTKYHYAEEIVVTSGDGAADRPDPSSLDVAVLGVGSGTPRYAEYNTNNYLNVDDLLTGANDGDTTYDIDNGTLNAVYRNSYPTVNPASVSNLLVVQINAIIRFGVESKGTIAGAIFDDGTNTVYGADKTITSSAYKTQSWIRSLAPDGSSWDSTDLNNLQIGIRHKVGSNGADVGYITAIQAEALGLATGFAPETNPPSLSKTQVFIFG